MKRKLTITAFYLLLSVCSYSQNVLIDDKGDTLVAITIQQMDNVFTELIQKDSLMAQSEINASKELKYIQVIDSTKKDIKSLTSYANGLELDIEKKDKQVRRNRNGVVVLLGVVILQLIL